MYAKKDNQRIPKYKLIVNNRKAINIPLTDLVPNCLSNIKKAIYKIFSVEDYIDWRFEKDINYKQKKQGIRNPNKKNKTFLENTIFLEEDNLEEDNLADNLDDNLEEIDIHELLKQIPDKPKKSRKRNKNPIVKQTRRIQPSNIKFIEVSENNL